MQTVVINKIETQPTAVVEMPEYLLGSLIEQGPALLEADWGTTDTENIDWRFSPRRKSAPPRQPVQTPKMAFRSTLARFGHLIGVNTYSGHAFFQVQFADEDSARPERFAIYLCNEPTMGFWIRIYLYGIDRSYPNYGGMYDANVNSSPPEPE